ncbi:suppressor of SWI4 1 homolog isoform X2 [Antechinus flavipes]|uniref:suppressor of SWI4 1 homolog isoform X2 n=1 Tax=Antechinus flavipes TaxID=38775 RepID=UPI0022369E3F|nr:suppressor of SWI4 1 homolog isoform X2 [Antechinus flavipes]
MMLHLISQHIYIIKLISLEANFLIISHSSEIMIKSLSLPSKFPTIYSRCPLPKLFFSSFINCPLPGLSPSLLPLTLTSALIRPFTPLQVRRRNSLKDCVAVAGPLGVSHFLIFSKTEKNVTFRLIRLPGGPTLTFRVTKYSLVRDVVSSLRRHRMHEQQFSHPPLLVLNGFGPHGLHVKLTASVFQNMFPSINVHKVNLNCVKRCLLLSYDPDSQELQFRHYSLKVVPVGASRGMKKLLQEKFPNMSRLEDVSELLATGAGLSESEAEPDGEHNVTELPQAYAGRGNMKAEQSAVRLTEIGPRITMQLIKIQEGVGEGNVLYHSLVHKSEEELKATLATREQKLLLKAERRGKQEQDIKRKKEQREAHRKRSLEGMRRLTAPGLDKGDGDSGAEDPGQSEAAAQGSEEEDEAEYFRQAVGEEPDEDMFPKVKRRRPNKSPGQPISSDQSPGRGKGQHPKKRFRAAKGKQPKGAVARHFPRGQFLGRALASKRPHHKSSAAARA